MIWFDFDLYLVDCLNFKFCVCDIIFDFDWYWNIKRENSPNLPISNVKSHRLNDERVHFLIWDHDEPDSMNANEQDPKKSICVQVGFLDFLFCTKNNNQNFSPELRILRLFQLKVGFFAIRVHLREIRPLIRQISNKNF